MVLSFLKLNVTGSTSWVAKIPVSYQTMASKNRARMNNMKKYRSKKKSFHHIFSQTEELSLWSSWFALKVQDYEALAFFICLQRPKNDFLRRQESFPSYYIIMWRQSVKTTASGTFSSSRPVCLSLSAARLHEPLSSFIIIYCTVAFPSKYYESDIASAILENGSVSAPE